MKASPPISAIATDALTADSQKPPAQPFPHLTANFDFVVCAPLHKAAPLFGPEGERAWAGKHWNPEFIHPQPARDVQGAVFTIQNQLGKAVWVNTLFDLHTGRFQYVQFLSNLMVTVVDVRLEPGGQNSTRVKVQYTRTALTAKGSRHVTAMHDVDRKSGHEWEQAINGSLAVSSHAL